jgi:hypothetical protein
MLQMLFDLPKDNEEAGVYGWKLIPLDCVRLYGIIALARGLLNYTSWPGNIHHKIITAGYS